MIVSDYVITVYTIEYSLYITGIIPTVVNNEVNLTCGFESLNRTVTSYDWTAIDSYGDTRLVHVFLIF